MQEQRGKRKEERGRERGKRKEERGKRKEERGNSVLFHLDSSIQAVVWFSK